MDVERFHEPEDQIVPVLRLLRHGCAKPYKTRHVPNSQWKRRPRWRSPRNMARIKRQLEVVIQSDVDRCRVLPQRSCRCVGDRSWFCRNLIQPTQSLPLYSPPLRVESPTVFLGGRAIHPGFRWVHQRLRETLRRDHAANHRRLESSVGNRSDRRCALFSGNGEKRMTERQVAEQFSFCSNEAPEQPVNEHLPLLVCSHSLNCGQLNDPPQSGSRSPGGLNKKGSFPSSLAIPP